jgi:hypothetical protein
MDFPFISLLSSVVGQVAPRAFPPASKAQSPPFLELFRDPAQNADQDHGGRKFTSKSLHVDLSEAVAWTDRKMLETAE